jgi:hypothetical protein
MQPWGHRFIADTLGEQLTVVLEPVKQAVRPEPTPKQDLTEEPKAAPNPEPKPESSFASRFGTEEEKWHSFGPTRPSFQQALDSSWVYTVRTSGEYFGDAPISEQDLRNGLSPDQLQLTQLFGLLEGAGVPEKAQVLHAFALTGTNPERNMGEITLLLRIQRTKKDTPRLMELRRVTHVLALENRYSIRKLDPSITYTLEIRPKEGKPSSAVVLLTVPPVGGGRIKVSGQPAGELQYALQKGTYTVQGARELWLALPRWEQDGEAEMDISVTSEKAR